MLITIINRNTKSQNIGILTPKSSQKQCFLILLISIHFTSLPSFPSHPHLPTTTTPNQITALSSILFALHTYHSRKNFSTNCTTEHTTANICIPCSRFQIGFSMSQLTQALASNSPKKRSQRISIPMSVAIFIITIVRGLRRYGLYGFARRNSRRRSPRS